MLETGEGMIVSLYIDDESQFPTEENREAYRHLSWSPYDRMEIRRVSGFNDFF